ncbi:MAG TPA: hypothetical protein VMG12_19975 [Polyangiaceae bacterium]|nr:hypothetical protein [Polyangiaceae bacterium]
MNGLALAMAIGCSRADEPSSDSNEPTAAGAPAPEVDDSETNPDARQEASNDPGTTLEIEPSGTSDDPGMSANADPDETPSDEGAAPSTVQSMQLRRRGALGYCIQEGQFVTAELATNADGLLELSGRVNRGWDDPELTGCEGSACERLEDVGPIQLGEAQRSVLEELAAQLPEGGCPAQVNPACDPCVVLDLTMNGATFGGDPCTLGCSGSVDVVFEVGDSLDGMVSL